MSSGDWIYVSETNQLIVISNEIVEDISSLDSIENSSLESLSSSGILRLENESELKRIKFIEEPKGKLFKFVCLFIVILGMLALVLSTYLLMRNGLPFESAVDSLFDNPIKLSIYAIIFSFVTTMLHELMHIIFSRNELRINFDFKKSVATVPLTHIWIWSGLGRIAAITSGMSLDSILLLILLLNLNLNNERVSIVSSILVTRILWQFIIMNKNDIYILINFIADDPFYMEDLNSGRLFFVKLFSIVIAVISIGLWLVPIINKLT